MASEYFFLFYFSFWIIGAGLLRKLFVSWSCLLVRGTWNLIFQFHSQPKEDHLTRSIKIRIRWPGGKSVRLELRRTISESFCIRGTWASVKSELDQIFISSIISIFSVRFCGLLLNRPQLGWFPSIPSSPNFVFLG